MSVAVCPGCSIHPELEPTSDEVRDARSVLSVPQVHCAACISKIEHCLNGRGDVNSARVNLSQKRVYISGAAEETAVISALRQIGFDAFPLNEAELKPLEDKAGRALLIRLGIAGFAMMNVMLLSVAVWSGATDATRQLFHLISAMIALPSLVYTSEPFYRSAWSALRVGHLNMDVPITVAIILAAGASTYESFFGGHHAYFDAALSLTFFLLIGRYLDHRTRSYAHSAASELTALEVKTAERKTGAGFQTVPVDQLGQGDVVLVPSGVRVPVDGTILTDVRGIVTDRSFLTGESDAVEHGLHDFVQAGEINLGAPFEMRADAVGDDTSLRQMSAAVALAEAAKTRYTGLADQAARIYAPAVHLLALLAFIAWVVLSGDIRVSVNVAVAVLIITCPCALGLAVPAVSISAIGRLFAHGFLVKDGTALERISEVDTVVFDKTGTLTLPKADLEAADIARQDLSVLAALARQSRHPVSIAIAETLTHIPSAILEDIQDHKGQGISARFEGTKVQLGHGAWLGADFSGTGMRVGGKVYPITVTETLRDGALEMIDDLKRRGLDIHLISGDIEFKVRNIAQNIGIEQFLFKMTPTEKRDYINHLTNNGHRVLMVGDGLNDTAALAGAHASLAPSRALDAARAAADVLLMRTTMREISNLFDVSTASVKLSRQNFRIATLYNLIAVPIALVGLATPLIAAIAMSTSSITVLLNGLRIGAAK